MLKIHVVRQGGHRYYVEDLVPGRAEGTLVAGEAPGWWSGAGPPALGLGGTVEAGDFAEILDGRHPRSGSALRARRGDRSVAGYDLTFCAPKSVSLLHLLAPGEMAAEVGAGHQAAVVEATGYLEREAVGIRRTRGGRTWFLPSAGVVAGGFLHRTSRALDPHLHTHLVMANVAQGVDGGWSAVDGRRVFAHAGAAGAIYHARLRMELSERLGADWEVASSGRGEVVGVEASMRRLFSQRSAAIEEYVVRRAGLGTSPRTRGAFHATRPDKNRTRTVDSLVPEWRQRAAEFGFELADLTRVVGPRREVRSAPEFDAGQLRHQLGVLATRHRTVARRDVVAVFAGASTAGVEARFAEAAAAHVLGACGPPLSVDGVGPPVTSPGGRGPTPEPRWATDDVAHAVAHENEPAFPLPGSERSPTGVGQLLVDHGRLPPGRERASGPAMDRARVGGELRVGR